MRRIAILLALSALLTGVACSQKSEKTDSAKSSTSQGKESYRSPLIGAYVAEVPGSPEASQMLQLAHSMGINVLYNYALPSGDERTVKEYLDEAQTLDVQVIVSLKDFYDQVDSENSFEQWGNTNEDAAIKVVRTFEGHPAVWGFGITDENPESPADLNAWQKTLETRYAKIKKVTTRPVMATLVGWSADSSAERQDFLEALSGSFDVLNLDYYPVPCGDMANVSEVARDLTNIGQQDGWFTLQVFDWTAYNDPVCDNGRLPTEDEMLQMGRDALDHGAHNIMLYSLFDISKNMTQQDIVRRVIAELKAH